LGNYLQDDLSLEPELASVEPLADGLAGVDQTVLYMTRFAINGSQTPSIRMTAEGIVRGTPQRDFPGESRAIERWVRDRLRFTRDGLKVETLKTPQRMIQEIAAHGKFIGDCDDASILVATLLLAVGHAPSFQVLGRGSTPHHVNVLDRTTGLVVDASANPTGAFGYRKLYEVNP
jgi:hypothetical protein